MSYTVYRPKKLDLGIPHPDPVVENTSMAAVEPPELWYRLKLQVGFWWWWAGGVGGEEGWRGGVLGVVGQEGVGIIVLVVVLCW